MNLINNEYSITLALARACAMDDTEVMHHEIRKEPLGSGSWYVVVVTVYMDNNQELDQSEMKTRKMTHVDFACGWNVYSMKFMGIWPSEKMINPIENLKVFSAIFFMFFFVTLPQTINLFFIWGDFDLVVENLSMDNMTITIAILKTLAFWFSGKSIKGLLDLMEEDRKETTEKEKVERMMNIAQISRKISIVANIMCNSLVVIYAIMHLATNYTSSRGLFFPAYFPWDTRPSPNYELTFFGQLMGSFYACATYSVVDTFVATLVLHVCGQFSNLREELINLQSGTKREFQLKLGRIVKKHDYLNRFTETIESRFNMMLLIQMLGCTVTLCLESFQTLESIAGEKSEFFLLELGCVAFYVCYILVQLYLYCYVGEQLLFESTEMAAAAYECEWFNLSPNEAKCLILIMRRSISPLRITAGKFCSFNHEMFADVVKTSMGYLSVLYAVKSEE